MAAPFQRNYRQLLDRVGDSLGLTGGTPHPLGEISANGAVYPVVKIIIGEGNPRRVLISAGIHGDEPAGVEAVCTFLEQKFIHQFTADWELTLLPCLNPTGYESSTRENHAGKDLNREFKLEIPSLEVALARSVFEKPFDLTLELHEDVDSRGYYLYQKENANPVSNLGGKIIDAVKTVMPINLEPEIDGIPAHGGVISRLAEPEDMSWWPMALYSIHRGTPRTFTMETSTHFPMRTRVAAHVLALETALKYFLRSFG